MLLNLAAGKESKCVKAKGWLWDELEHSCFVRWMSCYFVFFINIFYCLHGRSSACA